MATPNYETIPEQWKAPFGPYRQAPAEYGGRWWYVSPFTSAEPWVTQGGVVKEPDYPEGFIETFGPRPLGKDYPKLGVSYQQALSRWQDDLKYFKLAGSPGWADANQMALSADTYKAWEMGLPKPYEGRYGFMVRFPGSADREFEMGFYEVQNFPHYVIARYQVNILQHGVKPSVRHPQVPPDFWGE